jgi:hypothetical protein
MPGNSRDETQSAALIQVRRAMNVRAPVIQACETGDAHTQLQKFRKARNPLSCAPPSPPLRLSLQHALREHNTTAAINGSGVRAQREGFSSQVSWSRDDIEGGVHRAAAGRGEPALMTIADLDTWLECQEDEDANVLLGYLHQRVQRRMLMQQHAAAELAEEEDDDDEDEEEDELMWVAQGMPSNPTLSPGAGPQAPRFDQPPPCTLLGAGRQFIGSQTARSGMEQWKVRVTIQVSACFGWLGVSLRVCVGIVFGHGMHPGLLLSHSSPYLAIAPSLSNQTPFLGCST